MSVEASVSFGLSYYTGLLCTEGSYMKDVAALTRALYYGDLRDLFQSLCSLLHTVHYRPLRRVPHRCPAASHHRMRCVYTRCRLMLGDSML
ncbi:hypothetical protein J6590_087236 [Homalodisca vitripennis]|nr:hypothetical protein J6590_087236 [Homalodisca vitripennis]